MKKKEVYLVSYIGETSKDVEVIVPTLRDFEKWLRQHNKERKEDGNEPEDKDDFEVKRITMFYSPISNKL